MAQEQIQKERTTIIVMNGGQVKSFRKAVQLINNQVGGELTFRIRDGFIHLQKMDPGHVCMVDFRFRPSHIHESHKQFGIHSNDLYQITRHLRNDSEVEMAIKDKTMTIFVYDGSFGMDEAVEIAIKDETMTIPAFDKVSKRHVLKVSEGDICDCFLPCVKYTHRINMAKEHVGEITSKLKQFDFMKIRIEDQNVTYAAKNSIRDVKLELCHEIGECNGIMDSEYDMKFLPQAFKICTQISECELYIASESPLKLAVKNDDLSIDYYLAPRIKDSGSATE